MSNEKGRSNDFPIVFYDGDCGFCNKSVQLILNNERSPEIRFSALQSDFSRAFFESRGLPEPDLSTFYFYNGSKLYQKSAAAFRVLAYLKWYWQILQVFRIIPTFLADRVYDFIARRRKKLAGDFCALPDAEQRKRFLVS